MASTATDRLGLEKMAQGDDYNAWGATLNNLFDMLDVAIAGNVSLTISGSNYTLTDTDYLATSEALNIGYIVGTSDAARSVIIPSEEKFFFVDNKSSYVILFKTSGGTGTVVLPGTRASCYCDGTECYRISTSGWGKASSTATTSGASVQVNTRVTGEEFTDALIVFNAVSGTNVANIGITMDGPGGTATYSGPLSNATYTVSGSMFIPNFTHDAGGGWISLWDNQNAWQAGLNTSTGANHFKWNYSGGWTTITISVSAGTLDAGAVEVWLR